MSKIILHLCADVGSDSEPYKKAGYDVICIGKKIGVENYHPPENVYGIIANPPCTMFSLARTKAKKERDLQEGMFLVKECLRIIWESQYKLKHPNSKITTLKFWSLENPHGFLKYFLGKPVLEYSPFEYGDEYQKRTHLWGYFNIPPKTSKVKPDGDMALFKSLTPSKRIKFDQLKTKQIHPEFYGKLTRQERRSICSEKFAEAFFKVNQ